MDVEEVRGAQPFEVRGSFDRELHRVDVRQDLRGVRADSAAGLLVGLRTSKAAGIDLHGLTQKRLLCRRFLDIAGAGFEPATFGL
jgi:hypothetical protein